MTRRAHQTMQSQASAHTTPRKTDSALQARVPCRPRTDDGGGCAQHPLRAVVARAGLLVGKGEGKGHGFGRMPPAAFVPVPHSASWRGEHHPSPITRHPTSDIRHPSPITHHPSPVTQHAEAPQSSIRRYPSRSHPRYHDTLSLVGGLVGRQDLREELSVDQRDERRRVPPLAGRRGDVRTIHDQTQGHPHRGGDGQVHPRRYVSCPLLSLFSLVSKAFSASDFGDCALVLLCSPDHHLSHPRHTMTQHTMAHDATP